MADDRFNLQRFVDAQQGIYPAVLDELAAGKKRSHWIWYIFPQYQGLGLSLTSRRYAIKSLDEAVAYLQHPLLSARLFECVQLVLTHRQHTSRDIFGYPDDLKFRSCLTLFALVSDKPVFRQALDTFYAGEPDEKTLRLTQAVWS